MWEGSEAKPQLFGRTYEEEEAIEDDPYIPIKPARRKELENLHQEGTALQGQQKELKLMDFVPNVGYFLAGGLSGITSRTATAPLDRLKVYLIAQTDVAEEAVSAAKSGRTGTALQHGVKTLWNACRDLWAAGGMRSMFAGECSKCAIRSMI